MDKLGFEAWLRFGASGQGVLTDRVSDLFFLGMASRMPQAMRPVHTKIRLLQPIVPTAPAKSLEETEAAI